MAAAAEAAEATEATEAQDEDEDGEEVAQSKASRAKRGKDRFKPAGIHFDEYYRDQLGLGPTEYESFLATLATPLPTEFRVLQSHMMHDHALHEVERLGAAVNAELPGTFSRISWYPGSAYRIHVPRAVLRGSTSASGQALTPEQDRSAFRALHTWLLGATENGTVIRQEAASMVPVSLLDLTPSSRVLDICAAPGSKTSQILEKMNVGRGTPAGVVVANEKDEDRADLLLHRLRKLPSPTFICCAQDAVGLLPGREGVFDAVVCDVPCSGDGMFRKQRLKQQWRAQEAVEKNKVQNRILKRAVELCRTGGLVVYSTCSFNPMENEAVVASVFAAAAGALEILPVTIPGLALRPGLTSWRVYMKGRWWESAEQGPLSVRSELFPPPGPVPLERCRRLLPQDNNTGGFFVALLRKTRPVAFEEVRAEPAGVPRAPAPPARGAPEQPRNGAGLDASEAMRKRRGFERAAGVTRLFPLSAVEGGAALLAEFRDFGLAEGVDGDSLLVKTTQQPRKVFYANALVREFAQQLDVVRAGVEAWTQPRARGPFRVLLEGLPWVVAEAAASPRHVRVSLRYLERLSAADADDGPLAHVQAPHGGIPEGSVVVVAPLPDGTSARFPARFSHGALQLLVDGPTRAALRACLRDQRALGLKARLPSLRSAAVSAACLSGLVAAAALLVRLRRHTR